MKQKERLNEIEDINVHIAQIHRMVDYLSRQKAALLKGCTHRDGSGNRSIGYDEVTCWICGKVVKK